MISSDWRSQMFEKKVGGPNFGQVDQNRARNWISCDFLKFGSVVFLEIAYNDSLQQFLTFSRSKICEKFFLGPSLGWRDPETRFFAIFSSLVHKFSLKLHTKDLVDVKPPKKNWGPKLAIIRSKTRYFAIFSSLVY